jgi:hypothetical protein
MFKFYAGANGAFLGVFGDGALPVEVGYVEVLTSPADGSDVWDGVAWVPIAAKTSRDLSPSEFRGMLASEELLGEVWDAMRTDLKGKTDQASKDMRFALAANRSKSIYNLVATLAMVGSFRAYAQSLYPDTDLSDGLSDATITAAWQETVERVGP